MFTKDVFADSLEIQLTKEDDRKPVETKLSVKACFRGHRGKPIGDVSGTTAKDSKL